ncbi:MAG: sugar phosphate isomerase/epimerase family protein, partial [Ardenticatenaceae bacterium]
DYEGTVRRVAEIGYAGVETAGFPGTTPREAMRLFQELDLAVAGAHLALPVGDRKDEVLDTAFTLGPTRMVTSLGPEYFSSIDRIKKTCEELNQASANAMAKGLAFGIHNHWWEFEPVDGELPYQLLLEYLDRTIFWEVDVYWVKTAGVDPAEVLRALAKRVLLLHIKDGPAERDAPMVPVGEGTLDFHQIVEASEGCAEWLIVELDRAEMDMLEAAERSYRYLVDEGLGHGKHGKQG